MKSASTQPLRESDLFRSYWDDGLLDLLAGLALLITGLGWESDWGPLASIQAPLWIVLWVPLRRKIVEPRVGFVKFSLARQKHTTHRLWQTLGVGVAFLVLIALAMLTIREWGANSVLRDLVPGLPPVLVALAAGLTGILTGARRFHLYGLLLLAAAAAVIYLARGPGLSLLAVSLVVVSCGLVLFTRFLHESREYEEQH